MRLLAVPHQLQGPNFRGYIKDSSYSQLVGDFIKNGIDFVFEEASGHGPTIAEECADALLGIGHYSDIDPSRSERLTLGIAETLTGLPVDACNSNDMYTYHYIEEHRKREELWLHKIQVQPFEKALLICGLAHILSVAFRLLSAGVSVEVNDYLPYDKLCTRPHAG